MPDSEMSLPSRRGRRASATRAEGDAARGLFASFIWAGFECATPIDKDAGAVDLLADTAHDARCAEDYDLLLEVGIKTVREGLSWRLIDSGDGAYDFDRYEAMMATGQKKNIQQIWDLDHYGIPLEPFSEEFVPRFAAYAKEAAALIRKYQTGTLVIVPINEITYFALMGGAWGQWFPFKYDRAFDMQRQLVRASIAAMNAIWEIDDEVRFLQVDPIFRRAPKEPSPEKQRMAREFVEGKFASFDMLCGRIFPELGGAPRYLDLLGGNYYWYNQEWILREEGEDDGPMFETMAWDSPGRISLAAMLDELYQRYRRPVVLSETGGERELRDDWWRRTLKQIDEGKAMGLPIEGVCCYPVIDSPDWSSKQYLGQGFWDIDRKPHSSLEIVRKYIERGHAAV